MRIIHFCCSNLIKIKEEARSLQWLLTSHLFFKDAGYTFTLDDLLNSFAKANGYSSWGGIVAKNKEKREYIPFTFLRRTHCSCYADKIANDLHISKQHLMAAASLLTLGADKSKDNVYNNMESKEDEKYQYCLIVTKVMGDRDYRHWITSLQYPEMLVIEFSAMRLKELAVLMPELASFLKDRYGATDDEFIAYDSKYHPDNDEPSDTIGFLSITYNQRIVYADIWEDQGVDEIWQAFYELAEKVFGVEFPDGEECLLSHFERMNLNLYFFKEPSEYDEDVKNIFPFEIADPSQKPFNYLLFAYQAEPCGMIGWLERRKTGEEPWISCNWLPDVKKFHKNYQAYREQSYEEKIKDRDVLLFQELLNLKDMFLDDQGRANPILEVLWPMPKEFYDQYEQPSWLKKGRQGTNPNTAQGDSI